MLVRGLGMVSNVWVCGSGISGMVDGYVLFGSIERQDFLDRICERFV